MRRIVFITPSLNNGNDVAAAIVTQANYLADVKGCTVFILLTAAAALDPALPLSGRVEVFPLSPSRIFRKLHLRLLINEALRDLHPDVILTIDNFKE